MNSDKDTLAGIRETRRKATRHGKGRRAITPGFYEALVEAYRKIGRNYSAVAREVGCNPKTSQRAWERGWVDSVPPLPWAIPIRDVIAEDQIQARAKLARDNESKAGQVAKANEVALQKKVESEVTDAISDAAAAKAEEAQVVRSMRRHTMMGLGALAHIRKFALPRLVQFLIDDIRQREASGVGMKTHEVLANLRRIEEVSKALSEQAQRAIEMERKILGEPDTIVGIQADFNSPDGAVAAILEARNALERASVRGVIELPGYWDDDVEACSPEELEV
jgi:hypothetical protein